MFRITCADGTHVLPTIHAIWVKVVLFFITIISSQNYNVFNVQLVKEKLGAFMVVAEHFNGHSVLEV
jgi:hypothetical protein